MSATDVCGPVYREQVIVISDHRLTFGRLQVYIDPDDQWVGRYRSPKAWYYCPVPGLVFRWTRRIAAVPRMAPISVPMVGAVSTEDLKLIAAATSNSGAIDMSAEFEDAPSGPHLPPQSDDRGEVAGTDTVEAQEGTQGGGWHVGRSWVGTVVEDGCPCPKESCGLVDPRRASAECREHPIHRSKSLRQSHLAENCPGRVTTYV